MKEEDYRALAEFRYHLRQFVRFSEEAARRAQLEPRQHQLLLAVKGIPIGESPTIRNLAEKLQLKHNTLVELIDRCAQRDWVARLQAASDRREVLIKLTSKGELCLRRISKKHQKELDEKGPLLLKALKFLLNKQASRRDKKRKKRTGRR